MCGRRQSQVVTWTWIRIIVLALNQSISIFDEMKGKEEE